MPDRRAGATCARQINRQLRMHTTRQTKKKTSGQTDQQDNKAKEDQHTSDKHTNKRACPQTSSQSGHESAGGYANRLFSKRTVWRARERAQQLNKITHQQTGGQTDQQTCEESNQRAGRRANRQECGQAEQRSAEKQTVGCGFDSGSILSSVVSETIGKHMYLDILRDRKFP